MDRDASEDFAKLLRIGCASTSLWFPCNQYALGSKTPNLGQSFEIVLAQSSFDGSIERTSRLARKCKDELHEH